MKNILLLIIATLVISGCSKENEEKPQRISYEEFCKNHFYGYLVNDTTQLINLTKEIKYNKDGTTYLVGTKSGKLWIALFDIETKKCIKEYISHADFPLDFTYDLGHGKNEIAHMDYLNVNTLFEMEKGFVCSITSLYSLYTIYIFNPTQTKYYLYRGIDKDLIQWYDKTFLIPNLLNNGDNVLCVNENGDSLFSCNIDIRIFTHNYIPINSKDFLHISSDDNYIFIESETLQDRSTTPKRLNLFTRTKEKEIFTCEFGNIENDILEIRLILTEASGATQNKDYRVNIRTLELE